MSVNKPLGFHPSTCIHPGNEGQAHLPAETEPPSRIDVGGINQPATAALHSLRWALFSGNTQISPWLRYHPAAWRLNGSHEEGDVINHQKTTTRWLSVDIATSSCRAAGSAWATGIAPTDRGSGLPAGNTPSCSVLRGKQVLEGGCAGNPYPAPCGVTFVQWHSP